MTVIAKGWKIREPTAGLTATGSKAKIVAEAVIRMGRRRTEAAFRSALGDRLPGGHLPIGVVEQDDGVVDGDADERQGPHAHGDIDVRPG